MQRIQTSSKTISKISDLFIEVKLICDQLWHRFSSPKFGRLGEGLGLDFGFDFRPCWGPKRRRNGIKTSSRKKMPTWAQHDPKKPPKTASWIGVVVGVEVQDRLLTALMPNKPSWTPSWHHVGPFFYQFWTIAGSSQPYFLSHNRPGGMREAIRIILKL